MRARLIFRGTLFRLRRACEHTFALIRSYFNDMLRNAQAVGFAYANAQRPLLGSRPRCELKNRFAFLSSSVLI